MSLINKKTVLDLLTPNIWLNLKNSTYYFGGSFFGLLLAIFTQPIFSRYLEPYDFAVMGYYNSIQAFFIPLFTLNFTSYYLSSYWDTKKMKAMTYPSTLISLPLLTRLSAFLLLDYYICIFICLMSISRYILFSS